LECSQKVVSAQPSFAGKTLQRVSGIGTALNGAQCAGYARQRAGRELARFSRAAVHQPEHGYRKLQSKFLPGCICLGRRGERHTRPPYHWREHAKRRQTQEAEIELSVRDSGIGCDAFEVLRRKPERQAAIARPMFVLALETLPGAAEEQRTRSHQLAHLSWPAGGAFVLKAACGH